MRSIAFLSLFACACALAAPGAHGPGGEHLDAPASATAGVSRPTVEASSEAYELVGRLNGPELSLLIDRFETNEPVLGAEVEVRFGELRARAAFHADQGDYAVDDATMLKALARPGEHALLFTVIAGAQSDLLEGTLVVAAAAASGEHAHDHLLERLALGGGALVALAIAALAWRRWRGAGARIALLLVFALIAPSIALAAPGAHGPGGEHLDAAPGARASGPARLADGSVFLPKPAQRALEIRTLLAQPGDAAATLELPARVVMDPNFGGRVQPLHGGRIEPAGAGLPVAGQAVAKGEVLAYVRHHAEPFELARQQSQLAELRAGRALAEQRVGRLEELEGTVPRKDLEAARTDLAALAERERRIAESIGAREPLTAPVAGVVAAANAVAGQVVESRDVLFEIVDPARFLVEAVLADPALAAGIEAAHLLGMPGATLSVAGVGRSLRDGLLPVTFRARSGGLVLALGQPVTVVAVMKERVQGIVLPAQAVVRDAANQPVVWIKAGAERFLSQAIRHRPIDAERVVVTHGLGADNRVVVRGAALIAQIR